MSNNGIVRRNSNSVNPFERQIFVNAPEPENGRVHVPDRPGFGVELNREVLRDTLVTS